MNITSVLLQHKGSSPLTWLNFNSDSGKMFDCSVPTSHRFRASFEMMHWGIDGNNLVMTNDAGEQKSRPCESIHQFKTGTSQ